MKTLVLLPIVLAGLAGCVAYPVPYDGQVVSQPGYGYPASGYPGYSGHPGYPGYPQAVYSQPVYPQPAYIYNAPPVVRIGPPFHRHFTPLSRLGPHDRNGNGIADRRERDRDRDGIPNWRDRDRDGDGVRNRDDRRPNNPHRH